MDIWNETAQTAQTAQAAQVAQAAQREIKLVYEKALVCVVGDYSTRFQCQLKNKANQCWSVFQFLVHFWDASLCMLADALVLQSGICCIGQLCDISQR